MRINPILLITLLVAPFAPTLADLGCCKGNMGGVSYCDSSAGRLVCKNGEYSSCYCTRHAVMDLQQLSSCCLWKGGIMATTPLGVVVCNDGSMSETCSFKGPPDALAGW